MKKVLPALICGFGAGVLNIVPFVKNFSCCIFIPLAAILAIMLYQKAQNSTRLIPASLSVIIGLLTGIFAALFATFFDTLIIFITRSSDLSESLPEIEKMLTNFPASPLLDEVMNVIYKISEDISKHGFSFIYTLSMLFSGLFINSIFGIVGGLIGRQILNNRIKNSSTEK